MNILVSLGDVLAAVLLAIIGIPLAWQALRRAHRQARCEHPDFRETMACDAVCTQCGKNLGFIEPWRERRRARQQMESQP